MAQAMVNFRMDADLKKRMDKTCKDMGMSATAAYTVFAKKVVQEKRIPFTISMGVAPDTVSMADSIGAAQASGGAGVVGAAGAAKASGTAGAVGTANGVESSAAANTSSAVGTLTTRAQFPFNAFAGGLTFIADDFDETPADFKEYV